MEFPHLKDSSFPHLDNVNVYKHANVFDYSRWKGKVSIKLVNVLWNSNYADVPGFDSEEERDKWFDNAQGTSVVLESGFNITPENEVRIPIPYNDAYRFNYMVVDMPIQTGTDNPLDYESVETRVKRWFYFVDDMVQLAPSTTEMLVSLDVWTTFYNTVEIPYLMLERGHAPMMQTSVAQYLANPIMNNEYLLADDFNYGNDTIIQTSNYVPIGNDKKYVLFCAPYQRDHFSQFETVNYTGNSTPPTYADEDSRWGHQLTVNDYEWKYGGVDYSNAKLPISVVGNSGILSGCECYAIDGEQAQAFFNKCTHDCVNFIHGIQAMFILDGDLFKRTEEISFMGYTLYVADRLIQDFDVTLTKNMFGFDSKYSEITKLYTSPYSELEVTDDEGNTFTAKVENTGNIKMHEEVSLVYPFLNYNTFFSGINGDGTMQYVWKNLGGSETNREMWASDFSKFMMNWSVPVYGLFVSSKAEYAANNFFDVQTERMKAIKDYRNGARYANTTYENTKDSMQMNTDNVAASGQTNTDNVAASMQTNIDNVSAIGNTNVTNTDNTGTNNVNNQITTNTANTDITAENTDALDDNRATSNQALDDSATANKAKLTADVTQDISYSGTCFAIDSGVSTAITNTNAIAGVDVAGVSGILSAFTNPTAIGSGIGGVVGAAIRGTAAQSTNSIAIGGNLANAVAAGAYATRKNTNATDNIDAITGIQKQANKDVTDRMIDAQTNNTATANQAGLAIARANRTTNNANADNIRTTNNDNATRTRDTNNANAVRLQNTNNANAIRMQNVLTANADYTRDAVIVAEKRNLAVKQHEVDNRYENMGLAKPTMYGSYGGDFAPDAYQRRGVRFNVRTQSKSAIAQAGDAMLRFGYALHRVWDMANGLHYGKRFTFWKAEDIWINEGNGLAGNAVNTIGDIFLKGVTVWRDPDEIGRVSIYDNI